MLLIITLVFLGAFAIVALLATAFAKPRTPKDVESRLASALRFSRVAAKDEVIDVRKEHRFSSIPWFHDLLSRMNFSMEVRSLLTQADMNWTPGRLVLNTIAVWLLCGYLIGLRTHSFFAGLFVGAIAGAGPLLYVNFKRNRRMTQIQEKLPDALDLMVSALRAGHSMGGALGAAAREAPEPLGREFRLCFEEQNFGLDLRTATDNLNARVPLQDLRIVTTAMLIHKESGGNLAEVLDKTGHVIRDRFRLKQQIKVHTAQGRLTGLVLMSMPLILGVILYMSNPKYIGLLFTHPLGQKMLIGAGVMNCIGLLIIRKIINIRI